MKLAIVYPIYNGLEYTKEGLKNLASIINHANLDAFIKIIIVDDGSVDHSTQWIKSNYPEICILPGTGELWWSGSMNVGLDYAFNTLSMDYVLCWNNDIIADKHYLSNLNKELSILNTNEFLCSKILYNSNGNQLLFSCGCTFNAETGKSIIRGSKLSDSDEFKKVAIVDWCGGMGMLIPKSLFLTNGYFDNIKFPQYKGDADYCLRAKNLGFKLKFCPNLIIYNDPTNSGINNKYNSIKTIIELLYSKRSIYNLRLNYYFYSKHCSIKGFLMGISLTYLRYSYLLLRVVLKNDIK